MNTQTKAPGLFRRMWLRYQANRDGKSLIQWALSYDETELTADWQRIDLLDRGRHIVPWSDVVEVSAFKVDRFSFDSIRARLKRSDGTFLEVAEEMNGFEEVMCSLPAHLSGCRPYDEWWHRVAIPAFETNLTVIWDSRNKCLE